jgi:uncharacterized RDD family membrane protein YckC
MNCPQCGEVCSCQPEPQVSATTLAEADAASGPEDGAWRDEVSDRLNRYRSRRKVRPPRYPSLSLPFEARALPAFGNVPGEPSPQPAFESVSNHALALDGMRHASSAVADPVEASPNVEAGHACDIQSASAVGRPSGHSTARSPSHAGAKIIEFPGFAWGPPVPPPDQLAEPVSERPRILDVPDVAPPPPALGGITIDAARQPEAEKRPGIDVPLQSAAVARRLVAGLVDGTIIAVAASLFGFIFWKVASVRPPLLQMVSLAAGIPCLFWVAYQYLLIVYAGNTPGLRVAGLELTRFDGTATTRSLRRWRVLASYLSAASVGMGYAWLFLDEDSLCWHDRITHTYLAPKKR